MSGYPDGMSNDFAWGEPHAFDAFADYRQGLRRGDRLAPDRWSLRDDGTIRCRVLEDGRYVYVAPGDLRALDEGTGA